MSQINVQNLTFSYDGSYSNIFENTSFVIDTTWKLGFIGRNGRGKTTFLNLLLGKYKYSGKIISSVTFDYFPFEVKNKNKLAIEVLEDVDSNFELWEVIKKMNQLQLNEECLYKNFNNLSNGEQTKLLLAVLFSKENNFLLIDEPTNHLDISSRENIKDFLNKQKGFILISHDRDFIDSCVDHIISINKNNIEVQKGNFSSWWQNKQNQDEFEIKQNEKLGKEIGRLKDSLMQTKMWANKVENSKNGTLISGVKADKGAIGHKSAKMMKRSKAIEFRQNKAIEEKSQLLKNIDKSEELFFNFDNSNLKTNLIDVKNLTINYGNNVVFKDVNFNVNCGDRVAICGKNGCGKSSILKLILGEPISYGGTIFKCNNLKISYICQKYDNLQGSLFEFAKQNGINQTRFLTMLTKLGFERKQFELNINEFSDGQKKKVLIAKSLCEEANLYVWDEPLNYIDVISRIQIEELIKNSNITLIFVEHDSAFVRNVATKIVNL